MLKKIWGIRHDVIQKEGDSPSYSKQGLYPHWGPGTGKTTVING